MMRSYYVGEMNLSERRNNEVKNAEPAFEMQAQLQTIPNPFSSQFKVRFNLVQPSAVSINIYDAKGSLVKKVQNGTMSQGLQQLNIDGSNWTNGIYYCEVIINKQRMIRKMILQNNVHD